MADVTLNYEAMRNAASQVSNEKTELIERIKKLNTLITQLTQGDFRTSTASGAFQQSFDTWHKSASGMIQSLENMSGFITKAAQGHQELDASLKKNLKQQ